MALADNKDTSSKRRISDAAPKLPADFDPRGLQRVAADGAFHILLIEGTPGRGRLSCHGGSSGPTPFSGTQILIANGLGSYI